MHSPEDVLSLLTRADLVTLAERFDVSVPAQQRKNELVASLSGVRALHDGLMTLSRDRLKEVCRKLGLDERGREKAVIVDRLLPKRPTRPPAAPREALEPAESKAEPRSKPRSSGGSSRQEALPFERASAAPEQTSPSALETRLWAAANILRGSPVDRTDWRSYILPLLFFKRICDVWDEEHAAMLAEYGEDFADEHRPARRRATPASPPCSTTYTSPRRRAAGSARCASSGSSTIGCRRRSSRRGSRIDSPRPFSSITSSERKTSPGSAN